MTNPKSIDPKQFDKFHNLTRLETIVIDCEDCNKKTVHIYMGDFGIKLKPQYVYSCMSCQSKYISLNKLR